MEDANGGDKSSLFFIARIISGGDKTLRDGIQHFHLLLLFTNFSFGARSCYGRLATSSVRTEKDTAHVKFESSIQIANLGPRISIALPFSARPRALARRPDA